MKIPAIQLSKDLVKCIEGKINPILEIDVDPQALDLGHDNAIKIYIIFTDGDVEFKGRLV